VTVTAVRATTSASAASVVELAVASRRRGVGVSDGGGGLAARVLSAWPTPRSSRGVPPRAAGPDTRNRTSNPDSWVLPGRTTIGR
jgi:hypothetical protein